MALYGISIPTRSSAADRASVSYEVSSPLVASRSRV